MAEDLYENDEDRPRCETCPYFCHIDGGEGTCQRHAPVITDPPVDDAEPFIGGFPEVLDSDWCGDPPEMPAWVAGRRHLGGVPAAGEWVEAWPGGPKVRWNPEPLRPVKETP